MRTPAVLPSPCPLRAKMVHHRGYGSNLCSDIRPHFKRYSEWLLGHIAPTAHTVDRVEHVHVTITASDELHYTHDGFVDAVLHGVSSPTADSVRKILENSFQAAETSSSEAARHAKCAPNAAAAAVQANSSTARVVGLRAVHEVLERVVEQEISDALVRCSHVDERGTRPLAIDPKEGRLEADGAAWQIQSWARRAAPRWAPVAAPTAAPATRWASTAAAALASIMARSRAARRPRRRGQNGSMVWPPATTVRRNGYC
eukprot:COSAG01_NODE_6048_length_3880_cov_21.012431_3_plen_258_part_00